MSVVFEISGISSALTLSVSIGESGLGKSTLVNTLFNTELYQPKGNLGPNRETPQTVEIQSITADVEENGVKLRLTVVDTPGFGDFVNNEESWKPILDEIESRFDAYLEQENRVNRRKMVDNRIHACIYFIMPTGHAYVGCFRWKEKGRRLTDSILDID